MRSTIPTMVASVGTSDRCLRLRIGIAASDDVTNITVSPAPAPTELTAAIGLPDGFFAASSGWTSCNVSPTKLASFCVAQIAPITFPKYTLTIDEFGLFCPRFKDVAPEPSKLFNFFVQLFRNDLYPDLRIPSSGISHRPFQFVLILRHRVYRRLP